MTVKPQTKIDKFGNITFEDNTDLAIYVFEELVIAANKDIGKMLIKKTRSEIPKETGNARRDLQYWARKQDLDLQIGYKKGVKGFYAYLYEIGAMNTPKLAPLLHAAESSLKEISRIYLYYLQKYLPDFNVGGLNTSEEISDE